MLLQTLLLLSACSSLLPLAAGRQTRGSRLLRCYALAGCFYDVAVLLQTCFLAGNTLLSGNLYLPLEFTLLALYYKKEVFVQKTSFPVISIIILLFYLAFTTYSKGWFYFNDTGTAVFNLYYTLVSLAGYLMLMREQKNSFLEKSAFFWANTAVIMYASGNLFIFLLRYIELTDPLVFHDIWQRIFYPLNILKNVLLGIALSRRQTV